MLFFGGEDITPFGFTCLAGAGAVGAGAAAYLLLGPAHRFGLVSRRRRDRFGTGEIPLVGGPALLLGAAVAVAALGFPLSPGQAVAFLGFFAVGLADDLREMRPAPKFALQAAVAVAAAHLLLPLPYLAFGALLLLFLVNACNYLDNMDAALAGIAIVQALTLVVMDVTPAAGAPLLLWALPPILFLAAPPARIYLGDSGSHLVGALLGVDALRCLFDAEAGTVRARFLLPILILFAVQLADMATVTVSRLRRRRPVFRGGTDHLSHRLVRAGFPVPRAVMILVLASAVCGVAALLLR